MVRVALVGAGYMAGEHARAFADIAGVQLAGVQSRTRAKAEALAGTFGIPVVASSIAELYRATSADLVVVAVSELSVREVCQHVFEHPWTCLIEKPAGYDVADATAVAEAARKRNRRAFVALNRRHYGSTRTVVADLEPLDDTRLIHVYDQEDPEAARETGRPETVLQNWMYANSIHVIDYLRVFGRGDIHSVTPIVRWTPAAPKFVAASVEFTSGDVGLYEAIWNGPGPWAVTVTTQKRRWELRPLEKAAIQVHGSRQLETAPAHDWDTAFKPGLRSQAQQLVDAAHGKPHRLPDLDDALSSMRLVQRIYGV